MLQSINFDVRASEFENVGRRGKTKFHSSEIRLIPSEIRCNEYKSEWTWPDWMVKYMLGRNSSVKRRRHSSGYISMRLPFRLEKGVAREMERKDVAKWNVHQALFIFQAKWHLCFSGIESFLFARLYITFKCFHLASQMFQIPYQIMNLFSFVSSNRMSETQWTTRWLVLTTSF